MWICDQGEILVDEVCARIIGQQLGDDRLRFLAVRALEIGELHKLHSFRGSALRWPVGSRLQKLAVGLERLGAEGKQRIGDQELAIGQGEERELRGLILGSATSRL